MSSTFRNPIIPGFYPDPSICRVGDDYYLVTSTFEWFPGVPIFHSRDLVHWRQIGHALHRPSQLNLDGVAPSSGIFAATIRYHAGSFYVITTLSDAQHKRRNFIVTATDPAGEWSDPYVLDDAPGIDPSLFFEAGRAWYAGNRTPTGADHRFTSQREIWLQELDLKTMQLVGEKIVLWTGMTRGEGVPEAPHLYHVGDYYYLVIAEGGTFHEHCVTMARSRTLIGAYEDCPHNPILTHRHLGRDYPISNVGHADLIETQHGEWWMVVLGSRPYGGYFYNLGRETWLVPVRWEDDWLIVSPGSGRIEWEYRRPQLPECRFPSPPACDHFDTPHLALSWNFLRTPRSSFWSLSERPGWLRLKLMPERLSERVNPAFIGRRQQHIHFSARAAMRFTPAHAHECAGLALIQTDNFHFRFVCTGAPSGAAVVRLEQRADGEETVIAEHALPPFGGMIYWKVEAHEQAYHFAYALAPEAWVDLAVAVDGRILSTQRAGGFTGAYIGMYASSNGAASDNAAEFDWFEYYGW